MEVRVPIRYVGWIVLVLATRQRDKLQAGEYVALISDAAGCTLRYRLSLTQPDELKVSLSEAFTLCKDQSRNLRATSNQENVSYFMVA